MFPPFAVASAPDLSEAAQSVPLDPRGEAGRRKTYTNTELHCYTMLHCYASG